MLVTEVVESGAPVYSQCLNLEEPYKLGGTVVFRVRRVMREKIQK